MHVRVQAFLHDAGGRRPGLAIAGGDGGFGRARLAAREVDRAEREPGRDRCPVNTQDIMTFDSAGSVSLRKQVRGFGGPGTRRKHPHFSGPERCTGSELGGIRTMRESKFKAEARALPPLEAGMA